MIILLGIHMVVTNPSMSIVSVAARILCTVVVTCWRGLRFKNCHQAESKHIFLSVRAVTAASASTYWLLFNRPISGECSRLGKRSSKEH